MIPRLAALVLAFGGLAAGAAAQTLALDSRDARRGWEAVGRIDIETASGADGGFCTGTLIASDLVLTAAHCLYDGDTPLDPTRMRFRAGLAQGEALAEAAVVVAIAHPGWKPDGALTLAGTSKDVALLRLASPIPSTLAAPFLVDAPVGNTVSVLSVAEGRSETLARERECRVRDRREGVIAFDCDVTFGSSGAPIFQRTSTVGGGRLRIVSIVSSGSSEIAVGPELVEAVALLRAAMAGIPTPRAAPTIRRLSVGNTSRKGTGARFVRAPTSSP